MRWAERLERWEELFVVVVARATDLRESRHNPAALRRAIG
eukprot:COSAG01_NODE_26735_length_704_cov_8.132231_1_plen_39_part_10